MNEREGRKREKLLTYQWVNIKGKKSWKFPGGLEAKDLALSLLWLGLDFWTRDFLMLKAQPNQKKKKERLGGGGGRSRACAPDIQIFPKEGGEI